MQTAATDSLVGRKLEGRYRIVDRIARGGMSTVYSAVDERLDRLVAVKVMSAALSADPAFTDRFAREARAAARLTHLNAVSVYDQGQEYAPDGHHVFLVMELVEGRTLRDLIRERGRLTTAEAVSIMEPVLSALAAAHRAGLVHHDVKPENILLSDDGVVKVADFGLARAVETDAAATRTGLIMGTVAYCSPEQISRGRADPRSDVYSAGVMLFELLTGKPPYEGDSAMNVAYQHVHNRVPAPSSKVRAVPERDRRARRRRPPTATPPAARRRRRAAGRARRRPLRPGAAGDAGAAARPASRRPREQRRQPSRGHGAAAGPGWPARPPPPSPAATAGAAPGRRDRPGRARHHRDAAQRRHPRHRGGVAPRAAGAGSPASPIRTPATTERAAAGTSHRRRS